MREDLIVAALNAAFVVGGAVLLSMEFGWKVGVGVTLLVWFLKSSER